MSTVEPQLPEAHGCDKLVVVLRALVAGIPLVGGSITEAWAGFFASPLVKRREVWLHELAIAVVELQKAMPDLSVESLQKNEAFITAVLNATSIAIRTHRQEKLSALRGAVKSSVLCPEIDEDLQAMFMRYLDDLTPWHLRVLSAFHDPDAHLRSRGCDAQWFKIDERGTHWSSSKDPFLFMNLAFPELASEHQFLNQLIEDLGRRTVIPITAVFHQHLPDVGPYTTTTGAKFMRFIGV